MEFTKEQMRAIESLHADLARKMAAFYTEIQEVIIDVDIAFVDLTTYAEFILSLGNPTASYTFTIEPFSGPAIFDYSGGVVAAFISHALSSKADGPMTAEERTVMGKIITRNLADLETIWEPIEKIQVSDAELETNADYIQVAKPGDTVLLVAFEMNAPAHSGLINVCYPLSTLESVVSKLG